MRSLLLEIECSPRRWHSQRHLLHLAEDLLCFDATFFDEINAGGKCSDTWIGEIARVSLVEVPSLHEQTFSLENTGVGGSPIHVELVVDVADT